MQRADWRGELMIFSKKDTGLCPDFSHDCMASNPYAYMDFASCTTLHHAEKGVRPDGNDIKTLLPLPRASKLGNIKISKSSFRI